MADESLIRGRLSEDDSLVYLSATAAVEPTPMPTAALPGWYHERRF
jgi:hypothetical protein